MAKTLRILHRILIICLLLGLNAAPFNAVAQEAEFTSNQFTQPDTFNTDWQIYQEIPETFELVAENELFRLHVNKTSLAFKVVDKRSGYVWHSNVDETEKQDGDRLNRTWTAFAGSGISIDYLDTKAIGERVSITNGNVELNFQNVDQGFEATVKFIDPLITMKVGVYLEANGVRVEIPFESIKEESPDFKLGLLYVYPFFASTRTDQVPGYMFVPDGPGSLIRFSATTKAKNMFYGKYYGTDLGMITRLPWDPFLRRAYKLSIPVIGMVHGYKQNAYLAVVEKGASYGEVHAHPSGIITNFNFMYNAFTYNQSYFQATNRSGAGVTTLQPRTNDFDVLIHYRFLTGEDSDYVGMANSYRQYLLDKGSLAKVTDESRDIGIRLEFLGGEKEKVLFWNRLISMTTVSQMSEILDKLQIENPEVIFYGWQPLGASTMAPTNFRLDSGLGSEDELVSLIEKIRAGGGNFYLYLDPIAALEGEKGYSSRYDLAMSITNVNLLGYNRSKVNNYLNYSAVSDRYTSLSSDVFSELTAGLALDNIGSTLFSDFRRDSVLNREQTIQAYQDLLAQNPGPTTFYLPNDYLFGFMSAYYDMPLTNSGYIYTTDTVPFLQIVFSGHVPYFGTALNFSSNITDDLLRHVDYGIYPSYFLTQEITAKILNTQSSWIYTSSYDQWGAEIERTYQWLNSLLAPVMGESIVSRQVVQPGVVVNTYSSGSQIYINYTDEPVMVYDVLVSSKNAVSREVLP